MKVFTLKKDEILRKKKSVDQLFTEGTHFFIHPFRISWLITGEKTSVPAQLLISVSKRNFRRAVDRNRIRRQIREAYRISRQPFSEFLENNGQQCRIAIIYTAKTMPVYGLLQLKIKAVLSRLISEINSKLNNPVSSLSDYLNKLQ